MALAIYIKKPPKIYFKPTPQDLQRRKKKERFFFFLMSALGVISVIFAIGPTLIWQLTTLQKLTSKVDQVPVPQTQVLSQATTMANDIQVVEDPDGFSYFETAYKPPEERPKEFLLTIPKLKIEKAKAKVDSLRFDQNLAHFPGSAIPGEVGNAFITGHSVLPQFADPKNYKTIFTKLSDLEVGDDIYVQLAGETLHFSVQYAKIVSPHDLSVLSPISTNGRNLTLMTCVPPGTNIKRLVVITSLI
ncbi:sortase [Candidatus Curtissbacteria bacterium]|nr:sortase [Candidatus Curtissbacteria bacterium]